MPRPQPKLRWVDTRLIDSNWPDETRRCRRVALPCAGRSRGAPTSCFTPVPVTPAHRQVDSCGCQNALKGRASPRSRLQRLGRAVGSCVRLRADDGVPVRGDVRHTGGSGHWSHRRLGDGRRSGPEVPRLPPLRPLDDGHAHAAGYLPRLGLRGRTDAAVRTRIPVPSSRASPLADSSPTARGGQGGTGAARSVGPIRELPSEAAIRPSASPYAPPAPRQRRTGRSRRTVGLVFMVNELWVK
jgi:hypothetical protein